MGYTWQDIRQAAGNVAENFGNFLGIPETGKSEWIAGGPTRYTNDMNAYAVESSQQPNASYNPPASYQPAGAQTQQSTNQFGLPTESLNDWQKSQVEQQNQPNPQSILDSGYNDYFGQLDAQLNALPGQRGNLEGMATNAYNSGVTDLGLQKEQGMADLGVQKRQIGESQVKNLNQLSEAIRQQFQSGQNMLGARGAGDSSAANMYSYALTKMGNKNRGDIMAQNSEQMNQVADREFKLNNIFKQETNNLAATRDQKLGEIAQWFEEQKNVIGQMKGEAGLQKSQQLLSYAMQQLGQIQSEFSNRRSSLETWAANNATNINQLKSNMASIGQFQATPGQYQGMNGSPQMDGGGNMSYWGGQGGTTKKYNQLTGKWE
jgi:hypothetical protein